MTREMAQKQLKPIDQKNKQKKKQPFINICS